MSKDQFTLSIMNTLMDIDFGECGNLDSISSAFHYMMYMDRLGLFETDKDIKDLLQHIRNKLILWEGNR